MGNLEKDSKIFVAGHKGLVGSAIVRALIAKGYNNLILKTRTELDLSDQSVVLEFFAREKPTFVFLAAAKVGGILANNNYPAEFIYENLIIETNVIHAAYLNEVKKLLFLGSSCVYPKMASQPIKEESLLTGPLEETNEWYAIAKIAGIKLCQAYSCQYGCDYISAMPANLYGPGDNFDLKTSHVLPALIRKFHKAKIDNESSVEIWGTGKPRREFLHVDDCADACVDLMNCKTINNITNIGVGQDLSIAELAELIKKIVGFDGSIRYNTSKPDGVPRKVTNTNKIKSIGWKPKISLEVGIKETYQWYLKNRVV